MYTRANLGGFGRTLLVGCAMTAAVLTASVYQASVAAETAAPESNAMYPYPPPSNVLQPPTAQQSAATPTPTPTAPNPAPSNNIPSAGPSDVVMQLFVVGILTVVIIAYIQSRSLRRTYIS